MGKNVGSDHVEAAGHRMLPNAAELMYSAEGPDHGPVLHGRVTPERHAVREHRVAADPHIMRNMHVGHHQVVVADGSDETAAFGSTVDGDELAYSIAASDASLGPFAAVFQILRRD